MDLDKAAEVSLNNGPGRDRTGDLLIANETLYQLSYRPWFFNLSMG